MSARAVDRALGSLLVGLVTLYRVLLSPFLAPACRFEPSCSAYAVGALRGHGFCRGSWLTVKRLLRCRPGGGCGCDPVPPATRGVVLTVALAAGALAGLQVSPAAAEGPELELRSEDFVIKVDAYHGAFRSITLLDPQFAQAEREPEAGIPPERLAAGPLELVTTWDGPFLPLQLHFTRLDPEPEVRRLLHRDMRAVFARAPEGALLARLGPLTGVEAQSAPISPGDLLVPVGGTAAIAKIEKAVSRDLYSLGAVGATELPAEGSTLKVDILRVGPFSQVFASDPRFEPVEAPNGVLRLAWPHPTRDKSDLRIERLYRVSGHYRLEHILRLHWAGAGVLKHQEDFALFGWAGAHMEEPSLLNPTPEVIQPVCGVGSSVEHADREIPGFTQFDSSDWAGIERRYFLLGVAVEVPGGPQGKALPQCLVKVGPISLLTAILHPVGDRLTASPRSTCRPAYVTGEGPSCEDLLESLGLDQFATAEDARRASGTLSLDERKSLVSVLDSDVRATVFAGPKDIEALEEAGHNYQAAMDFGILSPISKPLLWLLQFFYGLVPQWGVAIFLLTVTVKLLLLYWTYKSFVSMRGMSQLKPEMDKLKEKFGDDKQKMNAAMMDLYKRNNVSPLGGCLPMLIQMPVYIGLYRTIFATPDLYQAPLFLWITDLSMPDPYFVMPVLLGVIMIFQQRLTPTAMDSAQQKIMMWVMPIMFTGFMLFLPSGLVFYILVNSVLSIFQQMYIYRMGDKAPSTAKAA